MKKRERTKLVGSMIGIASAGLTIWGLVSRIRNQARQQRERKEKEYLEKETLEKEAIKEQLLQLFCLYEDWEFDSFAEFGAEGDRRESAACYYADRLYPYIKSHQKMVASMAGDNGTGHEPSQMTDVLFYEPACCLFRQATDHIYDNFRLVREMEIWLLKSGECSVATCFDFEKEGWHLVCRFEDRKIQKPDDLPVSFEELEEGFLRLLEQEVE